jgi:hypothetical protein
MTSTTVSRYRILEKLGGGGMGVTHKAAQDRGHHDSRAVPFRLSPVVKNSLEGGKNGIIASDFPSG